MHHVIPRRLTVLVTSAGFTATTEYRNSLGYWVTLSTTCTEKFPMVVVARVAERDDFQVIVRVKQ